MSDNKKFYSLLDTLQRTAAATGNIALGGAYLAEQKAEAVWASTKLRFRANHLEEEIAERLQDIGKHIYATHAGNPSDSDEMQALLQEIDHLKKELDAIYEQIGRRPEGLACPFCGADVQPEDRYCRECGESLFEEESSEQETSDGDEPS